MLFATKYSAPNKVSWKEVFAIFITLVFAVFLVNYAYNEEDVIPYSYGVYNPEWLPKDWYLGLKIEYRYIFSYLSGMLVAQLGFFKAIFWGRLLSYALFSWAFIHLKNSIRWSFLASWLSLIVFLTILKQNIGAGEWIIGGFETKAFAYISAVLSLSFALRKQFILSLLLGGFAFSFHLLVGGYHLLCLLPIMLIAFNKKELKLGKLFIAVLLFICSGILGLKAALGYVINKEASDPQGWLIYVQERVPHHVIPDWSPATYVWFTLLTIIALLLLRSHQKEQQDTARYTIVSAAVFVLGFIVYHIGAVGLMRFYFFRHANAFLPLLLLPFVIDFIRQTIKGKAVTYILIALCVSTLFWKRKDNMHQQLAATIGLSWQHINSIGNFDPKMSHWIKMNTPKEATFIIPPALSRFYIDAERSPFVSFKHSPQKANDIIEWKKRLSLLSLEAPLKGSGFELERAYNSNYKLITNESIKTIQKEYKVDYILTATNSSPLVELEVLYKSDAYILYKL